MFWMRVVCLSNGSIVFIFEAGKKEMKTHKLKRRKERKEYKQHWHLFKQWKNGIRKSSPSLKTSSKLIYITSPPPPP